MKKVLMAFAPAFLIFTLLSITSCSKDEKIAKVLVTHASPDAPGVDLLIDNSKVSTSALTFPNSTSYLDVEPGVRNVKVNAAGTSTSVINADVTLVEDKNYSIFAVNTLAKIEAILLEDNLTAPAAGKAHVRFGHLSPDAPAVDIALKGGAVVFPNAKFKDFTTFSPLDAGTYNLDVRVAGTTTVALSIPPITLEAGKIYTVFARGFLGAGTNKLGAQIIVNK
jgi:Domain of unknown function (DUF4397)